mmetsp:Transcript_17165/g.49686  ORF Transcript_17165/g.49686 Transcript_17165/m.49686 type:complete len:307 (+) Transcript_17165:59-979(+)
MGSSLTTVVFKPPAEATYGTDPNLIWLNTSENQVIPAFFIDRQASHTLLFSHGNAEDLGSEGVVKKMRELSSMLDVNIFAYEYTGYGMSTGEPCEPAMYADIEAAYKYLTDIVGVPAEQIVVYGWSLGSGPSVHLATKVRVKGLVLQSAVSSIYRVALPVTVTLPGDMFANVDKMRDVACPVFIMHGLQDETINVAHARQLAASCRRECLYPPFYVEGAGHCDVDAVGGKEFVDKFRGFLTWLDDEKSRQGPLSAQAALDEERKLRAAALASLRSLAACECSKGREVPHWQSVSHTLKTAGTAAAN